MTEFSSVDPNKDYGRGVAFQETGLRGNATPLFERLKGLAEKFLPGGKTTETQLQLPDETKVVIYDPRSPQATTTRVRTPISEGFKSAYNEALVKLVGLQGDARGKYLSGLPPGLRSFLELPEDDQRARLAYGRSERIADVLVVLGKDYKGLFPGLELTRVVMSEMGGLGDDRILVVALERDAINNLSREKREKIGLPEGVILDEDVPVNFCEQAPTAQTGFFHQLGREFVAAGNQVNPEIGRKLREMYLSQQADLPEDEKWAAIEKQLENSDLISPDDKPHAQLLLRTIREVTGNPDHDLANVPMAIDRWLQGKEVWWTNAGSRLRGPEALDIVLVMRSADRELAEIPTNPAGVLGALASSFTKLVATPPTTGRSGNLQRSA